MGGGVEKASKGRERSEEGKQWWGKEIREEEPQPKKASSLITNNPLTLRHAGLRPLKSGCHFGRENEDENDRRFIYVAKRSRCRKGRGLQSLWLPHPSPSPPPHPRGIMFERCPNHEVLVILIRLLYLLLLKLARGFPLLFLRAFGSRRSAPFRL